MRKPRQSSKAREGQNWGLGAGLSASGVRLSLTTQAREPLTPPHPDTSWPPTPAGANPRKTASLGREQTVPFLKGLGCTRGSLAQWGGRGGGLAGEAWECVESEQCWGAQAGGAETQGHPILTGNVVWEASQRRGHLWVHKEPSAVPASGPLRVLLAPPGILCIAHHPLQVATCLLLP